ncbi:Short-chain dehydrogenase/reductase SDR [Kalmanozyma brasiliensis GHG001]|uniref:Hydroxysteroid 17-beta dehydrogenase 11 n=1 Tax=Kalmanozyma brasiliensis (strain GHG001) TaxID=1365824 RepID=V5EA53_KALBG|nr:Short-chain dehydrogenase/reductase SDR [Kalmanozyma brasiliensis GHG001]EST07251.1 Short-chain dehydrogenase/reductase SDR [Kalmanozyma brasiliensis GHG001]
MSLTVSSINERLGSYYTRITSTRAGSAALAILAFFSIRRFFQSRKRIAARKAWANTTREVAVITGGSGGIGMEVVKQLSARGVKVAILDIVEPDAKVLSNNVRFYKADMTDYESILTASQAVEKELGPVTILVNNAGVANPGPSIVANDPVKTKLTIEVNLLSHFYTLKIFLPHMIRTNHGHVMAVASAGSFIMPAGGADYGATKAGVLSLHETLQQELELLYQNRTGVLCSIVHPYWIKTPMTGVIFNEKFHKKMIEPSLVGRKMTEQLLSGQGGSLYIPGWIGNLAYIRVLPHFLQHKIRIGGTLDLEKNRREERGNPPMP